MDTENSNICSSMDDRFRDNGTTTVFARFMRRSIYRLSSVGDRRVNEYLLPRLSSTSLRKIHISMQIFVGGKTVRHMQDGQ